MQRNVFISYKHDDADDFVISLYDLLTTEGHKVFLDKKNIQLGEKWDIAIHRALDSSEILIGVMTNSDSEEVLSEWTYAEDQKKRILPIKLHKNAKPPLYRFSTYQFIDFTKLKKDEGFHLLKKALQRTTATIPTDQERENEVEASGTEHDIDRKALIDDVRESWIDGVLEKSLHDNKVIKLSAGEGSTSPGFVLRDSAIGDYALPPSTRLLDVYREKGRRLLILGKPGSGKTFAMLRLAKDLLNLAEQNTNQPIPVIFNLSSWAENWTELQQPGLEDWMIKELEEKYSVSSEQAKSWISEPSLIPLLDGLDEVVEDARVDCVQAINDFLTSRQQCDIIVCSRVRDYDILNKKLIMSKGTVEIQDLTQEQIDHYLQGDELTGLRAILEEDEILQEMARTPFLLNTMRFVYRDQPEERLRDSLDLTDPDAHRKYLLAGYLNKRLGKSKNTPYTEEETRHYLSWIAKKMGEQNQSEFYIERMQPNWLEPKSKENQYQFIIKLLTSLGVGIGTGGATGLTFGLATQNFGIGLITGILFTLAWFVIGWMTVERRFSWKSGILVGSLVGLAWGTVGWMTGGKWLSIIGAGVGFAMIGPIFPRAKDFLFDFRPMKDPNRITIIELLKLNRKKMWRGMGFFLVSTFMVGVMWVVTLWGYAITNIHGYELTLDGLKKALAHGSAVWYDFPIALAYGTAAWLAFAFTLGVAFGFESDDTRVPLKPNQGIRKSGINARRLLIRLSFICLLLYSNSRPLSKSTRKKRAMGQKIGSE